MRPRGSIGLRRPSGTLPLAKSSLSSCVGNRAGDAKAGQLNRLSLLVLCYVHGPLGHHARLCPSQRCDPPRTACESAPPAALAPPLPGSPSYSPLSRAHGTYAKPPEMARCLTECKAPHVPPVYRAGLALLRAVLRSRPAGSYRSSPSPD